MWIDDIESRLQALGFRCDEPDGRDVWDHGTVAVTIYRGDDNDVRRIQLDDEASPGESMTAIGGLRPMLAVLDYAEQLVK